MSFSLSVCVCACAIYVWPFAQSIPIHLFLMWVQMWSHRLFLMYARHTHTRTCTRRSIVESVLVWFCMQCTFAHLYVFPLVVFVWFHLSVERLQFSSISHMLIRNLCLRHTLRAVKHNFKSITLGVQTHSFSVYILPVSVYPGLHKIPCYSST